MAEVTEFEKAKTRQEKNARRHKEWVESKKPVIPPKPESYVEVIVVDHGWEYRFAFNVPQIAGTRMSGGRTKGAYEKLFGDFVKKEFGKWQLRQTP